jgi:hypothetical protein
MAYKSGVILGPASMNIAGSSPMSIGSGTATGTINIGSSSAAFQVVLGSGAAGFSIGATANAHATVAGSISGNSAFSMQVATGSISISATNGPAVIKSGTGTLRISSDARASVVSIAAGAGSKSVVIGSTNGASPVLVRCGTGGFSLSSASGALMNILGNGETTLPIQAAFLAAKTVDQANVIGAGASATVGYSTETYDHGSNYDGVNTFTAPVTGRYIFNASILLDGATASSNEIEYHIECSNRDSARLLCSLEFMRTGPYYRSTMSAFLDMDAGDIAFVWAYGAGMAANDIDFSTNNAEFFYGKLAC